MVKLRNKNLQSHVGYEQKNMNSTIKIKRKNESKEIELEKNNLKKYKIDSTISIISSNKDSNGHNHNDTDDKSDDGKMINKVLPLYNNHSINTDYKNNELICLDNNQDSNQDNNQDSNQDNNQDNNLNAITANKQFNNPYIYLSSTLLGNTLIKNKDHRKNINKNSKLKLVNLNNLNNQYHDNIYNYSRLNNNNFNATNRPYYYFEKEMIQEDSLDPELLQIINSKTKIYPFYMHFITCVLLFVSIMIIKHISSIYFTPLLPLFMEKINFYIEEISSIYMSLKAGDFKYNCVYGGSPFQVAECEIKGGFNRAIMYTTIQMMEFCASIFSIKNIFQSGAVLLGIWQIIKKTVYSIPVLIFSLLKYTKICFIGYYMILLKFIDCYAQSINDA